MYVQLRRHDTGTPWGFRMNGGAEYGQPLYIQKVNPYSLAHKCGLQPGDGILQIGSCPTRGMLHETAKMEIIRAGNDVDFIVQRNVMPTSEPNLPPLSPTRAAPEPPAGPRSQVVHDSASWRGVPVQDPNAQSRSFKMLQQQLASE